MTSLLRRLCSCCTKPKSDNEEGESIEISRLKRRKAKASRANGQTSEWLADREPTLPSIVPADQIDERTIPSSSSKPQPAATHNGTLHPAHRSEPLTDTSKPDGDPDEISPYAGSKPMYRNVKNAIEDRNSLLQRLRRPKMAPHEPQDAAQTATPNGKQRAEAEPDEGRDQRKSMTDSLL